MITLLDPAGYCRTPWKNGGGVTVDIAGQDDVWRFGRTPITSAGPFSDYSGFDRAQVLVAGRGLVLQTPEGDIDVRTPFKPVRFQGETPIVSRLEDGPVEVVNLIGHRAKVWIDLQALHGGATLWRSVGTHLVYAAEGPAEPVVDGQPQPLAAGHCLRIEATSPTAIGCTVGKILVGSILCV